MEAPHHRKIELQAPADLSYLYANTVALSRKKLDLHFPPSANDDSSDDMKERVCELVDDFIIRTFTSAVPSISINGLDYSIPATSSPSLSSSQSFASFFSTREAVEYEPYDAALAARLTSLYSQLEALTTTVAQMRRDAPSKAAKRYANALKETLAAEDKLDEQEHDGQVDDTPGDEQQNRATRDGDSDVTEMKDSSVLGDDREREQTIRKSRRLSRRPEWKLRVPCESAHERERWAQGRMKDVYSEAWRTLARLQGRTDIFNGGDDETGQQNDVENASRSLLTAAGKVERARKALEVIESNSQL